MVELRRKGKREFSCAEKRSRQSWAVGQMGLMGRIPCDRGMSDGKLVIRLHPKQKNVNTWIIFSSGVDPARLDLSVGIGNVTCGEVYPKRRGEA